VHVIVGGAQSSSKSTKEEPVDIQAIVKELKHERDRLDKAIAALDETDSAPAPQISSPAAKISAPSTGTGHHLTPEGRKRLSDSMKKLWAAKRREASRGGK
jgi:hypothetical protein